jgi:hypothetical protein
MELVTQNNQLQLTEFYSSIDAETANYLKAKEYEIVQIGNSYLTDLGKIFKDAQDRLSKHGYGTFGKWIEALGTNRMQVDRMINRYELIVTQCYNQSAVETIESLPKLLSYEISKPSAEPKLVEATLKGEIETNKEFQDLKKQLENKDAKEKDLILQINAISKQLNNHQSELTKTKELITLKEKEIEKAKQETTTIYQNIEVDNPKLISELNELKKKLAQDRTEEYINTIKQLENEIRLKQSSVDNAIKNRDIAQSESERLRITLENNTKNDTEKFLMLIKDFINIQTSVINNDKIQNIKKQIFKIIEENK